MKLYKICDYVSERVAASTLSEYNYISTENMLPNKGGITKSSNIPSGNVIAYSNEDVLISNIRPYFKKIWQANIDGGCSADVLCVRAKETIYPRYLYYLLSQDSFFEYVMAGSKGCKMPRGDKQQIMQWDVKIPEIGEQIRIAEFLSSIDSKIELNRRINENLEQQAQALFKSWFVDNKNNEFQYYELGDITFITAGGDKPSVYSKDLTEQCRIPIYSNGIENEGLYGYTTSAKINSSSITISARGTIGYVCLRTEPYVPIVRLISVVPNIENLSAEYLYLWALTQNINGTGTTQQQLTVPNFRHTLIGIPTKEIMIRFNNIVFPIFQRIVINKNENKILSQLRDTLLPRLMSGKLEIKDNSYD